MKRRIVVMAMAALVGVAVYWWYTRPASEIVLTGVVTTDNVIVNAQVQGRVERLLVKQGDVVTKGQVLATIQPGQWQADMKFYESSQREAATQVSQAEADWKFQELQSAQQIAQADANVAVAESQVKESEADLEKARLTWIYEEEAYKKGVEGQLPYDTARMAYQSAQAHLESVKKQAVAAKAALELAKATRQQVASRKAAAEAMAHQLEAMGAQKEKAQVQLGYTTITAPIAGIVDVRASREGEVVNAGQAIVTLIDPDDYWVRADVEETYIERVKPGDKLAVRLPSGAERTGVVFYKSADAEFATQRDVSRTKRDIRTFEVRLRVDNADRALAVGMTAHVVLPVGK